METDPHTQPPATPTTSVSRATPYPPPVPAPVPPPPPTGGPLPGPAPGDAVGASTRTRFRRSRDTRVIGGVCSGLARGVGVDPILVRIVFAVLAFAGGTGVVIYGLLWVMLPVEGATESGGPRRPATVQQGVALVLIALGVLGLLRGAGLWFGDALVLPVLLAAAGSVIVWSRSDETSRSTWSRFGVRLPGRAAASAAAAPVSPVRILVGTLLVAGAIAGFLAANDALGAVRDLGLALIAALGGLGLLFGPWAWRLLDELGTERRQRIRQEERAELAAHLHDSVLQSLALIQRAGDDPRRMVTLARRQERELRAWLYGAATADATYSTVASALVALTEELEDAHDVVVEVVRVGDAPMDDRAHALLGAVREACTNAAKHAGVEAIDVYLEVDEHDIVAFVRDRGAGFDPAGVPDDRQGIRSSIVARLERHGGTAAVRSAAGEGTEVELCIPRRRRGGSTTTPEEQP